jgi:hypothetical protein
VLHALLAILIVTGEIRISHLVVIGTIFGSAEAFFLPAIGGLLPQTVPEEEIQEPTPSRGSSTTSPSSRVPHWRRCSCWA